MMGQVIFKTYNHFSGERGRLNGLLFFTVLTSILFFTVNGLCSERYTSIEKRLIDFISSYYGQKDGIHIQLNNQPSILKDESLKIRSVNFSRLPDSNGNGICFVEVVDKKGQARNVFVAFKAMHKKRIYVLKEAMKRGEIITEDKIVSKEIIFNEDEKGYPSEVEDIVGKQLKRDLNAGTAITKDMIEDYFVIKRNDLVNIVLEYKKLIVKAKGRAIDRGRIGDFIRVKNLTSQKEVLGKVTGSGIVKVEM